MCEPLPERINAERLAHEHTRVKGTIPTDRMPRLRESVVEAANEVTVELDFVQESDARATICGHAAADVWLTCQRCLEGVPWSLEARPALMLAHSDEEAAAVPEAYDPLLWSDSCGSLSSLVEDELLLAQPIVARHADPADCGPVERTLQANQHHEVERDNPFAVLSELKKDQRKE